MRHFLIHVLNSYCSCTARLLIWRWWPSILYFSEIPYSFEYSMGTFLWICEIVDHVVTRNTSSFPFTYFFFILRFIALAPYCSAVSKIRGDKIFPGLVPHKNASNISHYCMFQYVWIYVCIHTQAYIYIYIYIYMYMLYVYICVCTYGVCVCVCVCVCIYIYIVSVHMVILSCWFLKFKCIFHNTALYFLPHA